METENLIELHVQELDADICVRNEQEMEIENPVESYGLHTFTYVCVKNEQKTDPENPVDLYVQQHGESNIETTGIKRESEPEVLLHPQFHGVNVNDVKCEGQKKAEISPVASLPEAQSKDWCYVDDDGCETGDDESVPSFPAETGSGLTSSNVVVKTEQIASGSRNSNTDDQRLSGMRTQVWDLLELSGFASVATDSAVDEIVGMLMNKTLETTDQLRGVLGIDTDDFRCFQCNLAFPTEELCKRHFDSLLCEEGWKKTGEMQTHMRKASEFKIQRNEDKPYKCTVCSNAFGVKYVMQQHMRTVHDKDKPYKCCFGNSCSRARSHRKNCKEQPPKKNTGNSSRSGAPSGVLIRKKDQNLKKNKDKPYKCTVCCKAFGRSSHLRQHLRTVHNEDKPYKCTVCSKAFGQSVNMQRHMSIVHHKDKPHKCTVCSKAFGEKYVMQAHIRIVHNKEKPYKCTVCSKAFGQGGHLRHHMSVVHDKDKPHKCTVCSKAFGDKQAMQKHMRTVHDKEKPYKCTVCSKAFGRSSNMQAHMRTVHHKDKPYKYTVCCKAFGRSGVLRQHLRTVQHEKMRKTKAHQAEGRQVLQATRDNNNNNI